MDSDGVALLPFSGSGCFFGVCVCCVWLDPLCESVWRNICSPQIYSLLETWRQTFRCGCWVSICQKLLVQFIGVPCGLLCANMRCQLICYGQHGEVTGQKRASHTFQINAGVHVFSFTSLGNFAMANVGRRMFVWIWSW